MITSSSLFKVLNQRALLSSASRRVAGISIGRHSLAKDFVIRSNSINSTSINSTSIIATRSFSTSPPTPKPPTDDSKDNDKNENDNNDNDNDEIHDPKSKSTIIDGVDEFTRKLMQNRHTGIVMNPNGLSKDVLPGDLIVKTNTKTGDKRMVSLERSMGYFWDLKDLKDTNEKPILSNTELIPVDKAVVFPPLSNMSGSSSGGGELKSLADEEVSLPEYITKNNRSKDPSAECTLLVTCFNEYGNKMLTSWTDPYEEEFKKDKNRIQVIWLSINEGRVLSLLKYFINKASQNNIPEYRKKDYLMYYGECSDLRDVVRMHNRKTGYAFLLDGLGRVRFAGSGNATEDDVERIISFTKQLAPGLKASKPRKTRR